MNSHAKVKRTERKGLLPFGGRSPHAADPMVACNMLMQFADGWTRRGKGRAADRTHQIVLVRDSATDVPAPFREEM